MRKSLMALVLVFLSTALYAARQSPDGRLPAADDYTVLTGKVAIGTIDAHTIGVVVDDGSPNRHIFRLWTEAPLKTFRATSQSASIEFRGDELVVMAADQEWFYALVTYAGSRGPQQPAGFTGARYVGYGLNHEIRPVAAKAVNGSGRHSIVALDDCADFNVCLDNADFGSGGGAGGSGGGSCDAGGVGSSSCSTSNSYGSCSVTCSSSSYACCTAAKSNANANCRCVF
jgi:hypothetical protein